MSVFVFPDQTVSESKKKIEWHKEHIYNYLSYANTPEHSLKKLEIARLYNAYEAVLDGEKNDVICKTVTERFGSNFGPKYTVYPLIEGKIEELMGEYRQRPLKRKCLVNNPGAVINKFDKKLDMVTEDLLRGVNQDMQKNIGFAPETEAPEMELPDDIEEFFEKDYRTLSEEVAEDVLYQLLIVNKEKEKIYQLLRNYLISERVFAFLDEKDGHPSIFIPHILDCHYDVNPQESVQKDINYFVFDKFFTENEILNKYGLNKQEKQKLTLYLNSVQTVNESAQNHQWYRNQENSFRIRVVSMVWLSRKIVKFKVVQNKETGKEEYKILPDDYKVRNRDIEAGNIKSIEIDDVRHITMIGPDIVLSWGSQDKQLKKNSDHKKRFTPVVGLIGKHPSGSGEIRSVAKKLEDLQDFASEILYEIRLASRKTDGDVMIYDLANIPKEWMKLGGAKALEKVNFHLKRDGVQYINSRDKRSNPYAASTRLSNKGKITELMSLLALIEDLADKISGITKGQENPYAKATTAQINANASSVRAEEYFGIFDSFVDTLLERMVLHSKFIYEEGDTFTYFAGDNQAKFLTIFPDFLLDDIGVHIGDNRKEFEKNRKIEQMAEMAFMNAQSPEIMLDLIRLFNAETSTEKEAVLKKGLKALDEMREENNKAQQEQVQAQIQKEAQEKAEDSQLTRESHQKDIAVAKIYADNKADDTREKEQGQNMRKMADIEKELLMSNEKGNN